MLPLKLKIFFLVELLLCGVLGQRGDRNIIQFKDETVNPRKSTSFLSNIAQELIQRSSSSKVLSLNLSNLLLILVLKAIVFGAGFLGEQSFKGRDDNAADNIISEGEAALALGYFMGENCLYQAACEVPHTAKEYLGAAEIVFNTVKLAPQFIKLDEPFENVILELQKAVDYGLKGKCPSNYNCKEESVHRFFNPQ